MQFHRDIHFAANIFYKPQRKICCINVQRVASQMQQFLRSIRPIFHPQIYVLLMFFSGQSDFRDACRSIHFFSLDVGVQSVLQRFDLSVKLMMENYEAYHILRLL